MVNRSLGGKAIFVVGPIYCVEKATLAGIWPGGYLAFFGLGLIWILHPSIDGPRTARTGLRLLLPLAMSPPLEMSRLQTEPEARGYHAKCWPRLPEGFAWIAAFLVGSAEPLHSGPWVSGFLFALSCPAFARGGRFLLA